MLEGLTKARIAALSTEARVEVSDAIAMVAAHKFRSYELARQGLLKPGMRRDADSRLASALCVLSNQLFDVNLIPMVENGALLGHGTSDESTQGSAGDKLVVADQERMSAGTLTEQGSLF